MAELMARDEAFVMYESPHRIVKLLADIASLDPGRPVCVGRELTKLHEELVRGSAQAVLADFKARADIKGELAVMVAGRPRVKAGSAACDDAGT